MNGRSLALLTPNQIFYPDDVSGRPPSDPRVDTIVEGQVKLSLPTAKHVNKLQVELVRAIGHSKDVQLKVFLTNYDRLVVKISSFGRYTKVIRQYMRQ